MTPQEFIDKWSRLDRTERQAAQEHFIDLCHMLGEPTPNEADDPDAYTFEKGVSKIDGASGFADVWKRGCFGWEYKKDRANLDRAYQQLQLYSVALESPPLLIVSDTKRFRIYTNWTNTVQKRWEFSLEDLAHTETRDLLHNAFRNPEQLRPAKTREQVTKEAAKDFSTIAERLRTSGHSPQQVAHFLNRLVFCLFAEDVNLLQDDLFKRLLDTLAKRRDQVPVRSQRMLSDLFSQMRAGGEYGIEHILHFNGGLFDDDSALPLDADSLDILRSIAKQDWSAIDPSILGTLFERFLDPEKRAQIGAHYTDAEKIMMIIDPVILRPLSQEWNSVKKELADMLSKGRTKAGNPGKAALAKAETRLDTFLKRLADIRVLDPACGSGNFLYLALQGLKDLERRVVVEGIEMGLAYRVIQCGPHNVRGIEINRYAAELARTAIWIGNIQWLRRNGFEARKEPVLEELDAIECRDALITLSPAGGPLDYIEAEWPSAEFIVGNPPFLGTKKMLAGLGQDYTRTIRKIYQRRVDEFSDLVCWWFEKARAQVMAGKALRVGLVATNSIRGGQNRLVLDKIASELLIFNAWSDEPWVVDGAAVRVSLICFCAPGQPEPLMLDGVPVERINADLTASEANIIRAKKLMRNRDIAFIGVQKTGPFDVAAKAAREWLQLPLNSNSRPNADVLRPYLNGSDITRRNRDKWIIDFGATMSEKDAAFYEAPFEYAKLVVKPVREKNKERVARELWWRHWRPRPELAAAAVGLRRLIATPRVAKHRVFIWIHPRVLPDSATVAIAREDDITFGILHSRFHESWSLRLGTWLGVGNDPRYTPTTTFETFPFPENFDLSAPGKDQAAGSRAHKIGEAAKRLDELRNAWLNPPELIRLESEVVAGYPDRILPKNDEAAAILRERTLTNLYNLSPQWLVDVHHDLNAAVATAYGWSSDISEEDALAKMLELNLTRAGSTPAMVDVAENEYD